MPVPPHSSHFGSGLLVRPLLTDLPLWALLLLLLLSRLVSRFLKRGIVVCFNISQSVWICFKGHHGNGASILLGNKLFVIGSELVRGSDHSGDSGTPYRSDSIRREIEEGGQQR
ncbi:hypothetical protein BDV39DRAFT_173277 [Aspergillus sergii]|uniref:Uncharacterized protein n=1 Tax=Aspergillus sergii TaxID=1034303 RepID=A0A5N6X9Q5_9EURO|nr:hypothetical protein BDV39DRAFT_173277 [Aspergillus sergii]